MADDTQNTRVTPMQTRGARGAYCAMSAMHHWVSSQLTTIPIAAKKSMLVMTMAYSKKGG